MAKKSGGCFGCLGSLAVGLLVMGGLTVFLSDDSPTETTNRNEATIEVAEVEEVTEETEVVASYDNPLEQSAHDVFGDDLRAFNVNEENGLKDVYIETNIPMNLTPSMMRDSFEFDVIDYAEKVQDEDFNEILFMSYAETVDEYGNDSEAVSGTITLSKETISQINFEQFLKENLPNVADNYNMIIGE
ncbi:hypothetical protein HZY86_01140 [Aerococcaceae bacterium DSM 111020]|nr:hypothetical protein [Aerococcaceae bacterium DSM 111020]